MVLKLTFLLIFQNHFRKVSIVNRFFPKKGKGGLGLTAFGKDRSSGKRGTLIRNQTYVIIMALSLPIYG